MTDNEVYGWGYTVGEFASRQRIAVERDEYLCGVCLQIGDRLEIILDDATAAKLARSLAGTCNPC